MINSIRLQRFRSYSDDSFEFEDGVNIVIGPNASGKTNLLEAILVLAEGKSFRARDIELVQFSKNWARLDGYFGSQQRVVKLICDRQSHTPPRHSRAGGNPDLSSTKITKHFLIDDKPFKRLSLERIIPTVLFEPNHLQLISRGPEFRREYFDDILERTQSGFKNLSANYRRALAQRNTLLKQAPAPARKQLFAWNIRLSELGAQIAHARHELVEAINKSIGKSYSLIANKRSKVELIYDSPFLPVIPAPAGIHSEVIGGYSSRLLKKLETAEAADFARGFTVYGPHREDFVLYLNKQPAQATASRGEIRSLLIALKIFELSLIEKLRGAKPIFLLDDVFSELDGARRHHLVDHLKNHQVIITTTDADAVLEHFSEQHRLISISSTTSPT